MPVALDVDIAQLRVLTQLDILIGIHLNGQRK